MKNTASSLFEELDFGYSQRLAERKDHFRPWAAEAANQVVRRWKSGDPINVILEKVAEYRKQLAISMNSPNAEQFGAWRTRDSLSHLNLGYGALIDRASRGLTTFTKAPLCLDLNNGSDPRRLTRQTYHQTLGGETIATTRIGRYLLTVEIDRLKFEAGTLLLEHTSVTSVSFLLKDVFYRIEQASKMQGNFQTAVATLSDAMYAYYHAMPFCRGSAAIGRVFFSGLFLAILDAKLPELNSDPDLLAMTALNQEEFRAEVLRSASR